MMKRYECPKCDRSLSLLEGIVLIGETGKRRTVYCFNPEPGNYDVQVADGVAIEPGTMCEFICPLCGKNLTSDSNKRLARLKQVGDGETRWVLFSKVANEHATFVLGGEKLELHGKDAEGYTGKSD